MIDDESIHRLKQCKLQIVIILLIIYIQFDDFKMIDLFFVIDIMLLPVGNRGIQFFMNQKICD